MVSPHDFQHAFMGSVTVGERGQVVIPIAAREKCGLEPGDKLLAFVHPSGAGVFLMKLSAAVDMAEAFQMLLQTGSDAVEEDE
ncbi:MAG TPA: AbrB/MazE/SpoVT family DNA-binding domain-containing protein [Armatimonadota bacterium]|jgi:AbrB family looped-hinge helix DNA binding protein